MKEVKIVSRKNFSGYNYFVEVKIKKIFEKEVTGYFLIDTGASYSAVIEDYKEFLREQVDWEIIGIAGSSNTVSGVLDFEIAGDNYVLSSVSAIGKEWFQKGKKFIGILGLDFFRNYNTVIDLDKNILIVK